MRHSIAKGKEFLKTFVEQASTIYGPSFLSIKVHNLIHIGDDVEYTGYTLNETSAFSFESYLGSISKVLRAPTHIVKQYCKRQTEKEKFTRKEAKIPPLLTILKENKKTNKIIKVKYRNMILTATHLDNTILLINNNIADIQGFVLNNGSIELNLETFMKKEPVFESPCISENAEIWTVNSLSKLSITAPLHEVQRKLIKFHLNFSTVGDIQLFVVSLLH